MCEGEAWSVLSAILNIIIITHTHTSVVFVVVVALLCLVVIHVLFVNNTRTCATYIHNKTYDMYMSLYILKSADYIDNIEA